MSPDWFCATVAAGEGDALFFVISAVVIDFVHAMPNVEKSSRIRIELKRMNDILSGSI